MRSLTRATRFLFWWSTANQQRPTQGRENTQKSSNDVNRLECSSRYGYLKKLQEDRIGEAES